MVVRTLRAEASLAADMMKLKAAQDSTILTGTVLHIKPHSSPTTSSGDRHGKSLSLLSLNRWMPWAKAK